ncbi:MAG: DUF4038 domain-containing protein, partial [Armatimonadia bacterium]|nr:DUF4038 domain-containing protein [Armatimonadia bacterium]
MQQALRISAMISVALLIAACGRCRAMAGVQPWSVHEVELVSDVEYERLPDVHPTVRWLSPTGEDHRTDVFWDGGGTWRARFAPGQIGRWRWRSRCEEDPSLDGQGGEFECVEAPDDVGGPLRVGEDRRYLERSDGTPLFWLADTAWNGALRATDDDWVQFLALRREQGFTAVQFVTTQWRGWPEARIFDDADGLDVSLPAYQRLDRMLAMVNEHGLVAAPVMLWTLTESDPGQTLSEDNAVRLCRYMVARWGAYDVVWLLGGDGRYQDTYERWRRIGRAVFGDHSERLVT